MPTVWCGQELRRCRTPSRSVTTDLAAVCDIRLIVFRVGVADLAGMEVRQAVALRGPGGLALISAAGRLWSGFRTMCQACPGPRRGVARKRSERQVLESGMPATVSSCPEHEKEPVDGGSDDRSGPAQGIAYCGSDRPGRGAAWRHSGPGGGVAGGAAAGVGSGVAGADLGGRGRDRAGEPAGPAARHRRRGRAGCPAEDGRPGAAARVREHEQKRPQRRPVSGRRRSARAPRAG